MRQRPAIKFKAEYPDWEGIEQEIGFADRRWAKWFLRNFPDKRFHFKRVGTRYHSARPLLRREHR